ncbi:type II secretion system F family protein [Candidatus Pacearchaeota archaeon]|nr:type II secretion system F family protein [Candidatus Pacearchaeota archaeon]
MKFKIPFTFSDVEQLKEKSRKFRWIRVKKGRFTNLKKNLDNSYIKLDAEDYLSIIVRSAVFSFAISLIFFAILFLVFIGGYYFFIVIIPLFFALFTAINQFHYPTIFSAKKARDIEKNLIPAMQDMLVQVNSGVSLYDMMENISRGNYASVSDEFRRIVKEIGTGRPQTDVIDEIGNKNTSVYFRRVLWQISNGLRSGSDMSIVIKTGIEDLNKEQVIQIQNYGSRLNPIIMFYMLIVIIVPALAVTFLTVLTSIISLDRRTTYLFFVAIFIGVMLMQFLFIGMIKTRRPSLL